MVTLRVYIKEGTKKAVRALTLKGYNTGTEFEVFSTQSGYEKDIHAKFTIEPKPDIIIIPPEPPGPIEPPTTDTTLPEEFKNAKLIYDSNLDLTDVLVGTTLQKEKINGTQGILYPSHAGGGDQGPNNHKVVKILNLVWKHLHGNKVRDYLDIYRKDLQSPNLLLAFDGIMDSKSEDFSVKFGNHSMDNYEFGGYGCSFHRGNPGTVESKGEYNHHDSIGGSNNGDEESEDLPKSLEDGSSHRYLISIQTVAGKREKILRAWIKYPDENTFTLVMPNRKFNDAYFKANSKFVGGRKDTEEIKKGVYLSALMRLWIRLNGADNVAKAYWRNAQVYQIGEFIS